ncbi:MAG TPA: class I SAM-dependent methyltransferase [Candidatus Baltobacteraceae bacterium]
MIDLGHRARHREFHRFVDDGTLDFYARHCGSPSGIGRLCLLDDRVLAEVVRAAEMSSGMRVLDLGCGRGFLARWLRWYNLDFRYVGVDRVPEAIAAARRNAPDGEYIYTRNDALYLNQTFDRVFALEAAPGGLMTEGIASAIGEHLAPAGKFIATLLSLDGRHDSKISESIGLLEKYAHVTEARDLSLQVKEFASTMCSAYLLGSWDDAIKGKMCVQAAHVLHAIETCTFNYTMLNGTARTGS